MPPDPAGSTSRYRPPISCPAPPVMAAMLAVPYLSAGFPRRAAQDEKSGCRHPGAVGGLCSTRGGVAMLSGIYGLARLAVDAFKPGRSLPGCRSSQDPAL